LRGTPRTSSGSWPAAIQRLWREPLDGHEDGRGRRQSHRRLRPDVNVQAAGAELDAIASRLQKATTRGGFPEKFTVVAQTLVDSLIGSFKTTLYALLAAVFSATADRLQQRRQPVAGARNRPRTRDRHARHTRCDARPRLIRQLLVESFVLAAAACAVGCGLAYFGLNAVITLIPAGTLPRKPFFASMLRFCC